MLWDFFGCSMRAKWLPVLNHFIFYQFMLKYSHLFSSVHEIYNFKIVFCEMIDAQTLLNYNHMEQSIILGQEPIVGIRSSAKYPLWLNHFRCVGLYWWHELKVEKRRNIAFSSHWWDFLFCVCPCPFYSKPLELVGGRMCKQERHGHARTHSNTHIARSCPLAAGDYVDYRMIRTPPLLHSFTLELNTRRKAEIWRKTSCVLSIMRKGVLFPLRPDLKMSDPSVNYYLVEQRGVSWKEQAGAPQT